MSRKLSTLTTKGSHHLSCGAVLHCRSMITCCSELIPLKRKKHFKSSECKQLLFTLFRLFVLYLYKEDAEKTDVIVGKTLLCGWVYYHNSDLSTSQGFAVDLSTRKGCQQRKLNWRGALMNLNDTGKKWPKANCKLLRVSCPPAGGSKIDLQSHQMLKCPWAGL